MGGFILKQGGFDTPLWAMETVMKGFSNLCNLRSLINKPTCYKNQANPIFRGEKLFLSRLIYCSQ